MRSLFHPVSIICVLLLALSAKVYSDDIYEGQPGMITSSIDSTGLLRIDDAVYRVTHRTKVGHMISPSSVTLESRFNFPLEAGTFVFFSAEPQVEGERFLNLEFIFRSID